MVYFDWNEDTTAEQVKANLRAAVAQEKERTGKFYVKLPFEKRCARDDCRWNIGPDRLTRCVQLSHRRRGKNKDLEALLEIPEHELVDIIAPEVTRRLEEWITELHDYWDGEPVKEGPDEGA